MVDMRMNCARDSATLREQGCFEEAHLLKQIPVDGAETGIEGVLP